MTRGPVVALGGGHGLAVTLRALRGITDRLTAVVGMADDGGSSGRLRRENGVPPPGDLRMALTALSASDEQGVRWSSLLQHRFSSGELAGHAVGNLVLSGLWEQTHDLVASLDLLGSLLGIRGRVLPACPEGVNIVADVADPRTGSRTVRGQAALAASTSSVLRMALDPAEPRACPEAVAAIEEARVRVMGPGSWFTSVLASLLVPDIRRAYVTGPATRILVLNLIAQPGETSGFSPEGHLDVLAEMFPDVRLDHVIADPQHVPDAVRLEKSAGRVGAELILAPTADLAAGPGLHDPVLLGRALARLI
jgi:uncharacterized cofD-like protein